MRYASGEEVRVGDVFWHEGWAWAGWEAAGRRLEFRVEGFSEGGTLIKASGGDIGPGLFGAWSMANCAHLISRADGGAS